jgi:hypothetical protein
VQTGQARILGSTRDVVAVTKDRTILPVTIHVVHLSGNGADAVFAGVLRPAQPVEAATVRVRGSGAYCDWARRRIGEAARLCVRALLSPMCCEGPLRAGAPHRP